jgi:eukaryotic translation initiation factor 2C
MINPSQIPNWIVVIYERQQRFNDQAANQMAADLVKGCESVGAASNRASWTLFNAIFIGIHMNPRPSLIKWESGQGIIAQVCCLVSGFFERCLTVPTATS